MYGSLFFLFSLIFSTSIVIKFCAFLESYLFSLECNFSSRFWEWMRVYEYSFLRYTFFRGLKKKKKKKPNLLHTRQIIKSNFWSCLNRRTHTYPYALHKIICSTREFIVKFFCFRTCSMQKRKRIYLLNPNVIKQQRIHLRVSYSYSHSC